MAGVGSNGNVVLVDWDDREVGTAPKLQAHQNGGKLHRAISVVILDPSGRMLLQRRAMGKYHAGGLWANACCSHPRPGETVDVAAHRRLREEMGIDCTLKEVFTFTYEVPVGKGLTEREFDHVFIGTFSGTPHPDPSEVEEVRWVLIPELYASVRLDSTDYTPWFKIMLVHMAHSGVLRTAIQSP